MRLIHWSIAPSDAPPVQKENFKKVQIDAVAIGLANAATPFLPVLLTRLGATNFQVGLLSSMPGITGLIFSIPIGRFLQRQSQIVPWFSLSRLLAVSAIALTGLAPFFIPEQYLVVAILAIWALATLPQTSLAITFSVVMNAVAGPAHRFDLMSRRWSILGITTAITVALAGQFLEKTDFPINYQIVFISLSIGGLISYYFSSKILLPATEPVRRIKGLSLSQQASNFRRLMSSHPDFVRFSIKRFIFLSGTFLANPLFPLYYVREVKANDAAIGLISTAQTAVLVIGYFFWTRQSRSRGSRFVLLSTTLGMAVYPALVAMTHRVEVIVLLAGLAGFIQAGLDLVFFDELMKTVPVAYSATFVSLAQSMQYASMIIAPMIGTVLAGWIGLSGALIVSGGIRFLGFLLFALWNPAAGPVPAEAA